jgi:hypothetical protein
MKVLFLARKNDLPGDRRSLLGAGLDGGFLDFHDQIAWEHALPGDERYLVGSDRGSLSLAALESKWTTLDHSQHGNLRGLDGLGFSCLQPGPVVDDP